MDIGSPASLEQAQLTFPRPTNLDLRSH
jgi:hypothetical protein